ncbi:MAG TPA: hypothetical protein PKI46_06625 [Bacteroidales bacterium]|nr:hypothetical protein [Bacteroidales bacterium]
MAQYRQRDGIIEVSYLINIMGDNNKIIKRNVKAKSIIHIEDIKIVDYQFTQQGVVDLKKCRIYHADTGWMVLNEKYDEISSYKFRQQAPVLGFQTKKQLKLNKK